MTVDVLQPAERSLQPKKFTRPGRRDDRRGLETFLHKIVIRNGHSLITFGTRGSQPVRSHEDCERGVSGIISPKARRR